MKALTTKYLLQEKDFANICLYPKNHLAETTNRALAQGILSQSENLGRSGQVTTDAVRVRLQTLL